MPSSMIHLFAAKKYDPNATIDFLIGNVSPDTVKDRDWKWDETYMANFATKEGKGWHIKYFEEISKMTAYVFLIYC